MARARLLKPGFFTNELLAELPFEGRLLFAGLWTLADKEGRLEDRPKRIDKAIFPYDKVDVTSMLAALETKGFIVRYTVNGMALIQVAEFLKHQTPHHREPPSTLPGPQVVPNESLIESPGNSRSSPAVTGNGSSSVTGNGSSSVTGNGSSSAELRSTPPVLTFPTQGKSKSWDLTDGQLTEWQGLYPGLDVLAECREAFAWVKANPGRAKSSSGMARFLVNWFNRSVDRRSLERRKETDRRAIGSVSFDCPHDPHCRTTGACVLKRKTA